MKKSALSLYLAFFFFIISTGLLAQSERNHILFGGQYGLNFSSNKSTYNFTNNSYESGKSRTLEISPQTGYFILHNAVTGLEFLYRYNKETGQEVDGYANYDYTRSCLLIPFVRYYLFNKNLKPYLHAGIGPGWKKTGSKNYNFPEFTQKSKLFFYEFRGGLGIFVNEHISFDVGIGFESTKTLYKEPMVDGSYNEWNTVTTGMNTTVGIVVCL